MHSCRSFPIDPSNSSTADSDDNEHFSDASEGRNPRASSHAHSASNSSNSPVPTTRVERVDDEPAHGEVPNTEAYAKRMADAVPDEVEIVPEGMRSRSASRLNPEDRPPTPVSVPKMVVEKIDPETPAYGDVPGTEAFEKRKMDAKPDEIIKSPETRTTNPWNGESSLDFLCHFADVSRTPVDKGYVPTESSRSPSPVELTTAEQTQAKNDWDQGREDGEGDEDGFGDDFDDFEEGGGDGNNDDDFGDFDDGFASAPPPGGADGFAAAEVPAPPITQPAFVSSQLRDKTMRLMAISLKLLSLIVLSKPLNLFPTSHYQFTKLTSHPAHPRLPPP